MTWEMDEIISISKRSLCHSMEQKPADLSLLNGNFTRIECDDLSRMMQSNDHGYDEIVIVDARFRYEYDCGHINGAINVVSPSEMVELYQQFLDQNVFIVFYCEYSVKRGPELMQMFRTYDRKCHIHEYPELSYWNIGILVGGYKNFYTHHHDMCTNGYVTMRSRNYMKDLRDSHNQFCAQWYKRTDDDSVLGYVT